MCSALPGLLCKMFSLISTYSTGYANSLINPLLYIALKKDIRDVVWRMLTCNWVTAEKDENGMTLFISENPTVINVKNSLRSTSRNGSMRSINSVKKIYPLKLFCR